MQRKAGKSDSTIARQRLKPISSAKQGKLTLPQAMIRARSEVGLSRLPVTEEIAGSNPVGPATKQVHHLVDFFRTYQYGTQILYY